MRSEGLVSGSVAPAFEAETYDGRRIRLDRYAGHQNVLLVFLRGFR